MNDPPNRPDPHTLLVAFLASGRSERTFTKLIESLRGLVFSSAKRRTGKPQLAEEITQNVFALLARKANSLRRHPALTAWVLEVTWLQSTRAMRAEQRRQRKTAAFADELNTQSTVSPYHTEQEANWKDALPVLDDALDHLSEKDRQIVLLRFFEGKKFHEIASLGGQSEAACKMRLKRALVSPLMENFFATPLEQDLLFARIAQISSEERAQLLLDVQKLPCSTASKDLIAGFISDYAPEVTSRENLEREIAAGRPSMGGHR